MVLRGELVERCQPGDRVDLCGTLIVVPQVAQLLQSSGFSLLEFSLLLSLSHFVESIILYKCTLYKDVCA